MKIAVLGLGAMGSRMAANFIAAGHDVAVYNRSPGPAQAFAGRARLASSPCAAATGADMVLSIVRDDGAARDVWLRPGEGALAGLAKNAVAIESSTVTPGWVAELGKAVATHGGAFLDAPVVGSLPQLEARQLIFVVGGNAADLARVAPALSATAGAIHHVGPNGAGATMKLTVNALLGIQVAAMAELLSFIERAGLEKQKAVDILSAMPVASAAGKGVLSLMAADDFTTRFAIELAEKDLGYALAVAETNGASLPATAAARAVFATAVKQGLGGANISAIAKLYR
jgi:3-hydroxyisobutyrate dehydrogenase-like beta-hydroxyacid dehydrogenase